MRPALYLGLMSGTSQDGVDAVLARFRNGRLQAILGHHRVRYPPRLRERLLSIAQGASAVGLREYARLDREVADKFADAALGALRRSGIGARRIAAIGSHGQTVFHDPKGARNSLQIGNPSLIAARTGITTIADFRRADIAAGGQGAPLVPAFHAAQFGANRETRVVANLGGIANISILRGSGQVSGFDTGPGNALLDEWTQRCHGRAYDAGGRWAASGRVHDRLLEALLRDSYFARRPPKSTGRDHFNLAWVRRRYRGLARLQPADVQRTLAELTVSSLANAITRHAPRANTVLVCGGGVRNRLLLKLLRERLAPRTLASTGELGLDPQRVEAAAFAWLAMLAMQGRAGNVPAVTGAQRAVVLGGIYPAPGRNPVRPGQPRQRRIEAVRPE